MTKAQIRNLDRLAAENARLAAERDALRDDLLTLEICQAKLKADRDRLAAENARLREEVASLRTQLALAVAGVRRDTIRFASLPAHHTGGEQ